MSVYFEYVVDVLATDADQLHQIVERLKHPSDELELQGTVAVETDKDMEGGFRTDGGKTGLVDAHLSEVSRAFPAAVFLIARNSDMPECGVLREVMRNGKTIQSFREEVQSEFTVANGALDSDEPM